MTTGEIDALREELLRRRLEGRGGARPTIGRADRERPLPLSYGQQQMWFLNRMDPGSPEYLIPLVARLRGPLDVATLRAAWESVVGRHEILRTRYALSGTEPVQVIDAAQPPDFPVIDLTGMSESGLLERVEYESAVPIDLAVEWPVRAKLFRMGDEDHTLVIVFHHIACDAWSMRVFAEELAALYRGEEPPPPRLQYADYAAWERGRPIDERHLAYWRDRLAGLDPLDLPTDRPRPPVRDRAGALVTFELPDADGVRELARRFDATPFMVLLAGFHLLLARYTGHPDVTVGTAVSRRTLPELQSLIGYGINSLVLRSTWDDDPSFAELLGRVRRTVLDAFDHQDVPFARLVDEIQPERDLSRTPIFQVVFDMVQARTGPIDLRGVRTETFEATRRTARFDLTLLIEEAADGSLSGSLEYATALFDESTIRRMAEHLRRLMASVIADPDAPASAADLLTPEERRVLIADWNDTRRDLPLRRVHEAFEERAAADPAAVAVVAGDERVSYGELDARANRLAHHLRRLGAGPESRVGVLLDRGPDLVAVLLGIWKAGAAHVPLDPSYPADRVAYMIKDSDARIIVTEDRHARRVPAGDLVVLERDRAVIDACPATPVPPAGDLDALAYVIYTSGSTGRPKGVLVTHRGLANYLAWTLEAYVSAGEGGAPVFSSVAFDLGVPDLYSPLMAGRPVHLLPQDFDVADLGRLLSEAAPFAFVKATPGHLALLAEQLEPDRLANLAGLAIAAGDAFTRRLADTWLRRAGADGTRLAAEYGPTEITVGNSAFEVTGPQSAELVPIGRPIPNTTMYVLDGRLQPVPIGVVGEVCVGGAGVSRGYVNRPDLTADRFVPDPFGGRGGRLYRTGDLGRMLPGGDVEFVGRADDQVKIRGYRIEIGEIQSVLGRHPRVRDAVVVADRNDDGVRLVAYHVPGGDGAASADELARHCAAALPDYMIPTAFMAVDRIPLTANGKVDRAALPVPDRATLMADAGFTAPRTEYEERVAAVWAEVLEVDQVGVEDGFFDLGGDSIRAVAVVGALREAGFEVTVRDVFEHRTVAELAEHISGRAGHAGDDASVAPFALIPQSDRARLPEDAVDAYPLSRVQLGMLIEMLADDGQNKYHNVTSFRIRDERPFAPDAFRRAVRLVVERHEVLRTSFDLDSYSTPLQIVHASAELPVDVRDLRGMSAVEQEEVLREYTRRNRADLFDLRRPPLLRLAPHVCDGDVWWLSTTECHPILEGWSHHSLIMELLTCYRRLRDGLAPDVPPSAAVRYADFIAAEQRALESAEDQAYWQGIVQTYPKFRWPSGWGSDRDVPAERYVTPMLYFDLVDDLRALASRARVSLKSVLLAAHLKVLSMLTD
ncbi:amino acid adenylation domain-containing protein, partial [Actinoallomurus spadix]